VKRPAAAVLLVFLALAGCASGPPSAASSRFRSLVLVEASGGSLETETFVSRFLLVLSDAGLGNVVDARLAGARIEMLKEASSPEAVRFLSAYPGDGYLGLDLSPCFNAGRAAGIKCTATVTLLSPEGKELAKLESSASNSTGYSSDSEKNPEAEASRAAGEKAAKKLLALLTR
jgi:hypothetical protein